MRTPHPAIGLFTVLLLSACSAPAPGPVLGFTDPDGSPDGIIFPLAKGRHTRFDVTPLSSLSRRTEIDAASSSDARVFEVEGVKESTVTVKALEAGRATLKVVMKSGLEDAIELEVREEGEVWLLPEAGELPNAIDASGAYNLAVGDTLSFNRFFYGDADSRRLSGVGPIPFGASDSAGEMSIETSPTKLVVRAGKPGDEASIETPHGVLRFRTVDALSVSDLTAFLHEVPYPQQIRTGTSFEVSPDGYVIRFLPLDADGYAYVGGHPLDLTIETTGAEDFGVTSSREENRCTSRAPNDGCTKYEGLDYGVIDFTTMPPMNETASLKVVVGAVARTFEVTARFEAVE